MVEDLNNNKIDSKNHDCEKCLNWNFDIKSRLSLFNPPENYPMECCDSNNMIWPRLLTY